jgi:hypothetical protein
MSNITYPKVKIVFTWYAGLPQTKPGLPNYGSIWSEENATMKHYIRRCFSISFYFLISFVGVEMSNRFVAL